LALALMQVFLQGSPLAFFLERVQELPFVFDLVS